MEQDQTKPPLEWTDDKRAYAAQWLIEKRLERIRKKLAPQVFVQWAKSLDLLLQPIDEIL